MDTQECIKIFLPYNSINRNKGDNLEIPIQRATTLI